MYLLTVFLFLFNQIKSTLFHRFQENPLRGWAPNPLRQERGRHLQTGRVWVSGHCHSGRAGLYGMRQYEWEGHCPYGGGVFLCVCCGHGCYGKISCLWGLLQYTYLQFFEDTYVSSRFTMSSSYHDNYGLGYKRQNFHLTINCISQDYPYQLKTFSFLLSFPSLNLICTLHLHILYYVGIR